MWNGYKKFTNDTLFGRGFKAGLGGAFGFQYEARGSGFGRHFVPHGFFGMNAPAEEIGKVAKGVKGHWMGSALGLGFTAFSAYQGYQEDGIRGAAKGIAINAIQEGVVMGLENLVGGVAGSALGVAMAGAGLAYGGFMLGEAAHEHTKKIRNLEMGADIVDTFGTISTMRQRSLAAIQNSHVNGRLALGGEASLMHTPYMR